MLNSASGFQKPKEILMLAESLCHSFGYYSIIPCFKQIILHVLGFPRKKDSLFCSWKIRHLKSSPEKPFFRKQAELLKHLSILILRKAHLRSAPEGQPTDTFNPVCMWQSADLKTNVSHGTRSLHHSEAVRVSSIK